MDLKDAVARVCDLARAYLDPERVARSRSRHAAILAGSQADYIPIVFGADVQELDSLPSYDWKEQWHDPGKSFVEQMKTVVRSAASGADYVPGVRADTGVINGPSLFGAQFEVPAHTKPVVTRYVPKEQLASFVLPDDLRGLGTVDRIVEHMQHHLAALRQHGLDGLVSVYHCDTQGPFDIAEQTRGHELFTDVFEDPDFVHHLMTQATEAYIGLSLLCKRISGEGETRGNASGYWMEKGGVRLCDDSGILLSVRLFEEFVLPYHMRALERFGGGWIHYCGGVPAGGRAEGIHLHDSYLKIPALRGLNFTTGRDWPGEVRKIIARNVAYIGGLPRHDGESLEQYFRRVLSLCPGRKGMIFGAAVKKEERHIAVDLWHRLQDEMFPANKAPSE